MMNVLHIYSKSCVCWLSLRYLIDCHVKYWGEWKVSTDSALDSVYFCWILVEIGAMLAQAFYHIATLEAIWSGYMNVTGAFSCSGYRTSLQKPICQFLWPCISCEVHAFIWSYFLHIWWPVHYKTQWRFQWRFYLGIDYIDTIPSDFELFQS